MSPHADIGVNPRKTEYLEVIDNSVSLGNLAVSCERRGGSMCRRVVWNLIVVGLVEHITKPQNVL